MVSFVEVSDEPVTPAGRLFLQPEMKTTIYCAIGFKDNMDMDDIRSTLKASNMLKHPRFSSILVRDHKGFEHWRRTEIDIDQHLIHVDETAFCNPEDDVDKSVNDYIADLSATNSLSSDKPLWEIHIMMQKKCAIFRIHHALGDGISLMTMLLGNCRKIDDPADVPSLSIGGRKHPEAEIWLYWRIKFMGILKMIFFNLVFCFQFLFKCLVSDRKTVISGGDGVELWPRKVATATFSIQDMKIVKSAVPNATINDVLFGMISAGISRYLDHRSPNSLKEGQQLTGIVMVNLREPGMQDTTKMMIKSNLRCRWGNMFGFLLLPTFYSHKIEPLEHVKRSKAMMDRKKQTLEAHLSYKVSYLIMSLFGPKVSSLINHWILCNTTFTISNIVGPKEEITLAGNPVTFIRVSTSSLPQGVAMHMVSYAMRAEMQIVVAKDIIPDPQFLAKCFQDSLLEMRKAATAKSF